MSGNDVVRQALEGDSNIVEIEVEYRKGNKAKYNLLPGNSSQRQSQIERLLSAVKWEKVEEVEIEYVDGYKKEIDLDAKPRKNKKTAEALTIAETTADDTLETAAAETWTDPIAEVEERLEEREAEALTESEQPAAVVSETVAHTSAPILIEPEETAERKPIFTPGIATAPASSPVRHYPDSLDDSGHTGRSHRRRRRRKLRKSRKIRTGSWLKKRKRCVKSKVRSCKRVRSRNKRCKKKTYRPLLAVRAAGSGRNNPSKALLYV
ncbi:hypothetical protein [Cohnella sp. GCM10027633]|uniref:hypothetical protein n=1 Tax=unclassified Cohnella TaxID=2636738 RepID=UPI003635535E